MKYLKKLLIIGLIAIISIAALMYGMNALQNAVYPQKYAEFVDKYSALYNVDKTLVFAVIKCESGFRPDAVSHAGAVGLMQLTDETFRWVATKMDDATQGDDIKNAETNIKYGTKLLSLHLTQFKDEKTALAAYNAGRGEVMKWLENPSYSAQGRLITVPFEETNTYIERVENAKKIYERLVKQHEN